ncbi:DUF6177 family protein [Streptomyces sp. NPDC005907]|uniref:DUF6177 family protein n=1 Tax=Streptomyces sp. NPDC005907 TaxID=3154571 RepID=UPI0033D69D8A
MTKDVIALTPKMPDVWALLTGLYAGGPDLGVSAAADGAVIQLHGPGGRPLVSVEAPVLVQVPGEAQRLLGPSAAGVPLPFWWTEARASTAVPEAERLAAAVCGRLNALLGGITWPAGAARTEVVDTSAVPAPETAEPGTGGEPQAAGSGRAEGGDASVTARAAVGLPAVDVLTDSTAVVLADRPVIALTSWLSEILREASGSRRALQIVTPPHVRLSPAARTTLARVPNRWVVEDPDCGYYDGLSGAVLRWQGGTFTPALTADGRATVARAFSATGPTAERQLHVAFRTRHAADPNLLLGGALETAWRALTGAPPAGWGTAEPVNLPWSPRQLTDLAHGRAPAATHLIAVGDPARPAAGTLRVTRTAAGVEEDMLLILGFGEDEELPLDAVQDLAGVLVGDHALVSLLVSVRPARRDLTAPPLLEAPPVPFSLTLGPEEVRGIGLAHARRPPVAVRPVPLGPAAGPALHYPLGDGRDPRSWATFQQLTQHLKRG